MKIDDVLSRNKQSSYLKETNLKNRNRKINLYTTKFENTVNKEKGSVHPVFLEKQLVLQAGTSSEPLIPTRNMSQTSYS